MTCKNRIDCRVSSLFRSLLSIAGLLSVAAFLLLSSCSSEQHLTLREDGSGEGRVVVDLHPMFIQYLKDVSAGFIEGDMDDGRFSAFDIDEIAATMEELEGISLVSALVEEEGVLDLAFVFSDPEAMLFFEADVPGETGESTGTRGDGSSEEAREASAESDSPQLVEFSSREDERTLEVRINSDNFSRFFPLIGVQEQETLMTFGPQPDPYTESEYIEMMQYALGDYEDAETIRRVLSRRESKLTVEVDGEITDLKGFTRDGNTAKATIPFLRAATLSEPLELAITWRPE
ncbi:MAG: hypothetical protein R6V67_11605 [Spirochaetia bacterium]